MGWDKDDQNTLCVYGGQSRGEDTREKPMIYN